ncbi:unnamed protein product [Peronospora belbahrii]|uniref:40S ribosomal protein S29 n=1 Tax=Peronospora belbahrii TaxID=622444 RepID=A0ABN8CP32_9STRA|nr:unnamed protein product [Peronospora belbahrii]
MANLTYSHPRTYGKDSRHCRVCKTTRGLIRKYHLNMCRRCFRERATDIGFVKSRPLNTGACDCVCMLERGRLDTLTDTSFLATSDELKEEKIVACFFFDAVIFLAPQ